MVLILSCRCVVARGRRAPRWGLEAGGETEIAAGSLRLLLVGSGEEGIASTPASRG